jgi:DNA repair protein RecO (recombination protein O)
LKRINYGEADSILTLLTYKHGTLSVIAKGSRRQKSKLAGGLELFSVSNVSFIEGRSELKTVVSAQLERHYGSIVKDVERTMAAYEFLRLIDTQTEHECDEEFFLLLDTGLAALNEHHIGLSIIQAWFLARLLRLIGADINVEHQVDASSFEESQRYNFSFDDMAFFAHDRGNFEPQHIKLLRLFAKVTTPANLLHVSGAEELAAELKPLLAQCVLLTR